MLSWPARRDFGELLANIGMPWPSIPSPALRVRARFGGLLDCDESPRHDERVPQGHETRRLFDANPDVRLFSGRPGYLGYA